MKNNKEHKKFYDIEYRRKNKDKIKKYRESHRAYYNLKSSEYSTRDRFKKNEELKTWYKNNPWMKNYRAAKARCTIPSNNRYYCYGARGIKCLLTKEEIKELWFRDKAYLMDSPSIDRKNNDGNYTFDNCRFIEKVKNVSPKKRTYNQLRTIYSRK